MDGYRRRLGDIACFILHRISKGVLAMRARIWRIGGLASDRINNHFALAWWRHHGHAGRI